MSVELYASPTHKAVVFSYSVGGDPDSDEGGPVGETITIEAENVATGDVGSREGPNAGSFLLFYPLAFAGVDRITVRGSDGGEDSGTVEIPEIES